MRTALTIAGTDPSGGAGIQADLKTMTAHRVYGMSAITAVVAQNTTGVTGIMEVTPEFLAEQLDDVFTDIFPDAVKIGMVSSSALIRVIAEKLKQYHAKNIVLDPVMVATAGSKLISDEAISTLKEVLIPLADVITPNIPEMEVLSGMTIQSDRDMERAAAKFAGDTCTVPFSAKAAISLTMPMISCMRMGRISGSMENGLPLPIPTVPDARCPAPSLLTWQRAADLRNLCAGRRHIYPVHLEICWIWEREAAP